MKILKKFRRVIASISMMALLSTFVVPVAQAGEGDPPPGPIASVQVNIGIPQNVIVDYTADISEDPSVLDKNLYFLNQNEVETNPTAAILTNTNMVEMTFSGPVVCGTDELRILDPGVPEAPGTVLTISCGGEPPQQDPPQQDPPVGPPQAQLSFAFVDRAGDDINKVEVGFTSDVSENSDVVNASYYSLMHGTTPITPSSVVRLSDLQVELDFTGLLGGEEISCGYMGANLTGSADLFGMVQISEVNCQNDEGGGHFGSDVLINEVVTSPQSDWSTSDYDGSKGVGTVNNDDEFLEIAINESGLDLTGYEIYAFRGGFGNETTVAKCILTASPGCEANGGGEEKFTTVNYVGSGSGSITDTDSGDFLVLAVLDKGGDLGDNDYFEIYNPSSYMVEDSLPLGAFDDGYVGDNALAGTSSQASDEAIGRNSTSTALGSASEDFFKQAATPGLANTFASAIQVISTYSMGSDRIGLDFNQVIGSSSAIPANFSVKDIAADTTLVISNVYNYGLYVDLELSSSTLMQDGRVYEVTVSANVTGSDPLVSQVYTWGSSDSSPPTCNDYDIRSSTEIELYCWDENGLDTSSATATLNGGLTVDNIYSQWDSITINLDSSTPLVAGEVYTLTVSGLKDSPNSGTPNVAQNINLAVSYDPTAGMTDSPLMVMDSSPSQNSWDVARNISSLSVQFSKPVNPNDLVVTGGSPTLILRAFDWNTYDVTGSAIALDSVSYDSETNTAVIVNSTTLDANQAYELEIVGDSNGVKSIYNETMPNYYIQFTTGADNDTTGPTVNDTSVDVYDDGNTSGVVDPINVPLTNSYLQIYFSEPMNSATINAFNLSGNVKLCTNQAGSENCLGGEVWYDESAWTAGIYLSEPLQPYTDYTITVSTAVKDQASNALASRFTRSFSTGQSVTTAPSFSWMDCSTDNCYVMFDRAMGSSVSTLVSYSMTVGGQQVSLENVGSTYHDYDNALEITGLDLTAGETAVLTVSGGTILDSLGNQMSNGSNVSSEVFDDDFYMDQSFWVEGVYPDWGLFDVPQNTSILVQFSDEMAESTVSNIQVAPITGWSMYGYPDTGTAVSATATYISNSNMVKITPSSNLTADTEYEVRIPTTVQNEEGGSLPYEEFRSFLVNGSTDSTAPTISAVTPQDLDTGIGVGLYQAQVRFNEAMDPASLTTSSITLKKTSNDAQVPGVVKYNIWDYSADYVPTGALEANTNYTLTVTTGVKDLSGNALGTQATTSFTTGAADDKAPQVEYAWSDGWMIGVQFNEHIQEDTIALTNFQLVCGTDTKILSDKSFHYESWNQEVMIEGASLGAGQSCTITVSKVKDMSDNEIGTTDNLASFNIMDSSGKFESNWVMYSYPSPGDNAFPPNAGAVEIGFQNEINIATADNTSIKLYPVESNGTNGTQVNFDSFSLSGDETAVYADINGDLEVDQEYHLVVTTGITDNNGEALMAYNPWDPTDTTAYDIYFRTSANTDASAPVVWGTDLDQYRNAAGNVVEVPQYLPIRIQFSKKMNVSTIADSDIANSGSNIQIKDNLDNPIEGDVTYLPNENAAIISPANALNAGNVHTLEITTDVADVMGNQIASAYSQPFTITSTSDTTKPYVAHSECEEFECRVYFSEPVKKSQAENALNYGLVSPLTVDVNVTNKTVEYIATERMAIIKDLSLIQDDTYTITVDSVQDIAGNDIATALDDDKDNNTHNGSVWANYDFYEDKFNKTDIIAGTAGFVMDMFGFGLESGGLHVEPMNKAASQETMWFVDIPVDQAVAENSYIQVKFNGANVTNAAKPTSCTTNPSSTCSPVNGDINGPGAGVLSFSIDSVNTAARTVTLELTGGATSANDFLTIDLSGIATPATKGDYTAEVTILNSTKQHVAGPFISSPYYVSGGGTGTIQGTITGAGVDDGETLTFELGSPWSGMFSKTATFNSGSATYAFNNLPEGDYDLYMPPVVTINKSSVPTDYETGYPPRLYVSDGGTVTHNITLQDLSGGTNSRGDTLRNVTVNVSGGTNNKKGTVEVGSWMDWYEKDFTFDSSGEAVVTFSVPSGQFNVNVWDYMPPYMMGAKDSSFIPPSPKFLNADGILNADETTSADNISMAVLSPNRYIQATVTDQDSNGIANADVYCYDPDSMFGGGNGKKTGSNGTAIIEIFEGNFKCEAHVPGIGSLPPQLVTVVPSNLSAATAAEVDFTIATTGLSSIEGSVKNGSDNINYTGVWCNEVDGSGNYLPGWSQATTDGSGEFSVLVKDGTWRCQAFIPGYGDTDYVQKTVAGANVTSVVLSPPADTVSITGTVLVNGSVMSGGVFAERENGDHKFSDNRLESDGSFTIRVKQSATDTYKVGVYIPGVIDKVLQTGVTAVSNTDLGSVDVSSGAALSTVTIQLKDVLAADFETEEAFIEFSGSGLSNYTDFEGSSGTIRVPNGDYTVRGFVKEVGELTSQSVSITADATVTFTLDVTPVTISGTVRDASDTSTQSGASVVVVDPTTDFKIEEQTDASGNYSIVVPPNATYNMSVYKSGYLAAVPVSQAVTDQNATRDLTISPDTQGITVAGTVTLGSTTANNNAMVVGNCTDGTYASNTAGSTGTYSLTLPENGNTTCTIEAFADGYTTPNGNKQTITPSANQTGVNIIATATGGTISPAKSMNGNPEQPIIVADSDAGISFTASTGTFNSSQSSMTITTKKRGDIAKNTPNATLIGDGLEITAKDAVGKTSLSKSITIAYDYSKDGITDTQAATVVMASFNENTGQWTDHPTVVDTATDTIRFTTNHFTIFGAKTNNDSAPPSAPITLTAVGGDGQVVLDWADNSDSDLKNYNVYRSTSAAVAVNDTNQINVAALTASTYTDSTATNGTTYYYVVTAVDTSDNESAASGEGSAAPAGTTTTTTTTVSSGGGGGGSSTGTVTSDNTAFADDDDDTEEATDEDTEEETAEEEATETTAAEEVATTEATTTETVAQDDEVEVTLDLDTPDYENHWAADYIVHVMDLGIAEGIAENRFDPDTYLTRAQLTKMVVIAAGYDIPGEVEETSFYDVDVDDWYAPYIEVAKSAGLVEGYNEWYFLPNQEINRAEAVKILVESALGRKIALDPTQGMLGNFGLEENPFEDLDLDEWYAKYVLYAYKFGIINGYDDGTLGPDNYMTRAEFAKIISVAMAL
jgi:hypothetical protein